MKLLFLTGSRGEWGYIRPILNLCKQKKIQYRICATNMHLLPSYGLSIKEIEKDGFKVSDQLYMSLEGNNHFSMTKSLGVCLMSFVDIIYREKPDWIILAGDRGEQLMGAIAGAYTYTPVAHIQAGEVSGNIDGMARHAIGKLVHLHFASNKDAGDRLVKLGEEKSRVEVVGAPQLDELRQGLYTSKATLLNKYEVDLPYCLVVQHPVTEEYNKVESQITTTIESLKEFNLKKVWILPNNDAGGEVIKQKILQSKDASTQIYRNLPRKDYLGLLKFSSFIIGNSSSGLLEAPTFRVPCVNIGRRQASRVQGKNVINSSQFQKEQIVDSINKALSINFRKSLDGSVNPYGDGFSSERIVEILEKLPRDNCLLTKSLTY